MGLELLKGIQNLFKQVLAALWVVLVARDFLEADESHLNHARAIVRLNRLPNFVSIIMNEALRNSIQVSIDI